MENGHAQQTNGASKDNKSKDNRKHVVIIGGGAAGMSCAATLANHPTKYRITILERASVTGGQATSIPINDDLHGANWMNDGVQGGSPAFKHTSHFFTQQNYSWHPVPLQVSFGKGPESFWTNVFPSQLVGHFKGDIRKFGRVLKVIRWTMPVLGLVPIRIMLRIFRFSPDFGDKMVYPLIALFLGTGNQTANVACAILERLFSDPNMKLWDYDAETLLPNLPTMVTFPKLSDFYANWADDLRSKGVDIRLNTEVTTIHERSAKNGITLSTRSCDPDANDKAGEFAKQVISDPQGAYTSEAVTEHYDELVMCVLADQAKNLLGKTATWTERFVLGGAKFYDDITITHWDEEYFNSVHETSFRDDLAAKPSSKAQEEQLAFAKGEVEANKDGVPSGYRPMYYTHSYPEDPRKIEMAFDATNYQHQFRMPSDAKTGDSSRDPGQPPKHVKHIYQSIFLDKQFSHLWTLPKISVDKVIYSKWWHQLGHSWTHYLRVVPLMPLLNNNSKATLFAGSWTLVNMHELACVSGIAAAWRLGAAYEPFDDGGKGGFAEEFFGKYLLLSHGKWYSKSKRKGQ